jgi:hypothetical protein
MSFCGASVRLKEEMAVILMENDKDTFYGRGSA